MQKQLPMELSQPIPAPVPPTQSGRGITSCQKSDKKGKKQNRNWNCYRLDIDPVQGFVVNHTVELRMLQIPLPRGTRLGALDPFSIPQPRSPPSKARSIFVVLVCFFFLKSLHKFDHFHQVFDYSFYWLRFLTELLTAADGSWRLRLLR